MNMRIVCRQTDSILSESCVTLCGGVGRGGGGGAVHV